MLNFHICRHLCKVTAFARCKEEWNTLQVSAKRVKRYRRDVRCCREKVGRSRSPHPRLCKTRLRHPPANTHCRTHSVSHTHARTVIDWASTRGSVHDSHSNERQRAGRSRRVPPLDQINWCRSRPALSKLDCLSYFLLISDLINLILGLNPRLFSRVFISSWQLRGPWMLPFPSPASLMRLIKFFLVELN